MGILSELEKCLYVPFAKEDSDGIGNERNYTKTTSIIGGTIFSGIGYTVTATGFLVKDLLTSLYGELPYICAQLSDGSYDMGRIYGIFSSSLNSANYAGGMGAAVGMIGGTILFSRMRNALSSLLRR